MQKDQEWFWSQEWQVAEEEAEDDIKAGRIFEFDSVDEAIVALGEDLNDVDTIGDDSDSVHGDYPEVLYEGRLYGP